MNAQGQETADPNCIEGTIFTIFINDRGELVLSGRLYASHIQEATPFLSEIETSTTVNFKKVLVKAKRVLPHEKLKFFVHTDLGF